MVPTTRSYSPGKAETAALLDYEVTEPTLPDTVSSTQHYSPHPRVIFFYSPPPSPPLSLPPCLLPPFLLSILLSILPLFPLLALFPFPLLPFSFPPFLCSSLLFSYSELKVTQTLSSFFQHMKTLAASEHLKQHLPILKCRIYLVAHLPIFITFYSHIS